MTEKTDTRKAVMDALESAGRGMSNICFNLSQETYIPANVRMSMKKAQGDWDLALRAFIALERQETPPPSSHVAGLSLSELQRAHVERQEEWCPDQKPDLSFRGNELGGECGEAQNVIKKLERERHGWRGSRDTVEHLAEELADVIHCAILVAITAGIEIEPAVVAKFNSTSEKNGLSTFLATTEDAH